MASTMIQTELSPRDFERYFENARLGKLYFPSGLNFSINLRDLYKMAVDWKVSHTAVPINSVIAIVSFGPATGDLLKHTIPVPRILMHKGQKKKEENSPCGISSADFLVVTAEDLCENKSMEPVWEENWDDYGHETSLVKSGINVFIRGVNSILEDLAGVLGLNSGVQIFSDNRLQEVIDQAGVLKPRTEKKVLWGEEGNGLLTGRIQ